MRFLTTACLGVSLAVAVFGTPSAARAQGACKVCVGYIEDKPVSVNGKPLGHEAQVLIADRTNRVQYSCVPADGLWPSWLHCETFGYSCNYSVECVIGVASLSTELDGRVRESIDEPVLKGRLASTAYTSHDKSKKPTVDCQARIIARTYSTSERASIVRAESTIII
jgi:hypothetical protein